MYQLTDYQHRFAIYRRKSTFLTLSGYNGLLAQLLTRLAGELIAGLGQFLHQRLL